MTQAGRKPAAGRDQLLHLVFGGELEKVGGRRFADLSGLDIVGIYPDYRSAYDAWRAKAQASVDNARMRYYVVHLHRLLDPQVEGPDAGSTADHR
jgi:uncharacterized protein DUF4170